MTHFHCPQDLFNKNSWLHLTNVQQDYGTIDICIPFNLKNSSLLLSLLMIATYSVIDFLIFMIRAIAVLLRTVNMLRS